MKNFTPIILSVILTSCGAEEEKTLTWSEGAVIYETSLLDNFRAKNVGSDEIDPTQMGYRLLSSSGSDFSSWYEVEATEEESGTSEEESSCADEEIAETFNVIAEGNSLEIRFDYELSESCRAEIVAGGETFFTVVGKAQIYYVCVNDVSSLHEVGYVDFWNTFVETCGYPTSLARSFEYTYYEPASQTSGVPEDYVYDYGLNMAEDGSLCQFTLNDDILTSANDCFFGWYTEESYPESKDYDELIMKNLSIKPGPYQWYFGGETQFTFNNWEGTVTYNENGNLPEVQASNGTDTISGNIAENYTLATNKYKTLKNFILGMKTRK